MSTNKITFIVPKYKALPLPNKLLEGKRIKSLAPSNVSSKMPILSLSSTCNIAP